MYSAARVNQFEMKDTCIEFVIFSRQGNNVKIKLSLNNIEEYCVIYFRFVYLQQRNY